MAGDWIKVEVATLDKPEVVRMAELLGIKRDEMVGMLFRFWAWLDRSTGNGVVTHMSRLGIDNVMQVSGFGAALEAVRWAEFNDSYITLTVPNYEKHNGNPAKTRALGRNRKREFEERKRNAECVSREEKRRDISKPNGLDISLLLSDADPKLVADWLTVRKAKKAALTGTAVNEIRREAAKAGLSMDEVLRLCCARNWVSFKASWDWQDKPTTIVEGKFAERKRVMDEIYGRSKDDGAIDGIAERVG